MLIRRYRSEDNEVVKELHFAGLDQLGANASLQEHSPYNADLDNIESVYLENGGEFLVGIQDDEIVAIGAFRKLSPVRAEIKRIRVRRDCQGRGYGKIILERLLEMAVASGYREACLDTTVQNVAAQRLFEKYGFTETHRGILDGLVIIYYEKSLSV